MSQPQPAQAVPTQQYVNQKTVCIWSNCSRSTLERLERSGGMPAPRRFGQRCKRYRIDEIQAWLDGTWTPTGQGVSHA